MYSEDSTVAVRHKRDRICAERVVSAWIKACVCLSLASGKSGWLMTEVQTPGRQWPSNCLPLFPFALPLVPSPSPSIPPMRCLFPSASLKQVRWHREKAAQDFFISYSSPEQGNVANLLMLINTDRTSKNSFKEQRGCSNACLQLPNF